MTSVITDMLAYFHTFFFVSKGVFKMHLKLF